MKIKSCCRLVLGSVFLLLSALFSSANAQNCLLSIEAPSNTASVNVEMAPAWWNFDFNAADNPSLALTTVYSDTAGIPSGTYLTWCIDAADGIDGNPNNYTAHLYSTCDTNIDVELPNDYPASVYVSPTAWHEINYILNHKNGAYFYDVQVAIWTFIGGPIDPGLLAGPNGPDQYPPVNMTEVNALIADATNNAANWQESCGDVIAVVVAVEANPVDQLLCMEVPYPCVPCISVTKEIACFQATNNCADFGKLASGYAGLCNGGSGVDEPAFCYQITITNCGTIPLTNLEVLDNLMGNLTSNFFAPGAVLQPGAGTNAVFSMSFASTSTNVVTVSGAAVLANNAVTNINGSVVTNGEPVSGSDSAVAQVDTASVSCDLTLTSPNALPGSTASSLILPAATYYSSSNVVTLSIHVCNTGNATLTNLTISVPPMASFTCTTPGAFSLPPHGCQDFQLCMASVSCASQPSFNVSVTGQAAPDAEHCAVFDTNNSPITVCSSCLGTVACTNACVSTVSGSVLVHCNVTNVTTMGDSALPGVLVSLLAQNNNVLATNLTDANGNFSFSGVAPGLYYVLVSTPTNYVETYPAGNTNSELPVQVVCSDVTNLVFGYADTTPPVITVAPGSFLGCNPTNIMTVSNLASLITASVSCGTATTNITQFNTNIGCAYTQIFTIVVTDTYGNSATNYVTNTWTVASLSFTTIPVGTNLGCNPAVIPNDTTISNGVVISDSCSTVTNSVTHVDFPTNCSVTRIFTITAGDACGDTATAYVTNTWTVASLTFSTLPASTNLGCNPASLTTDATISNGVAVADSCSAVTTGVTHVDSSNNCAWTRVFTITASDTCGDSATAYVTNTWTVASLAFTTIPTGSFLGCNPTNLPTDSSISNSIGFADTCSTVTLSVTHTDSTNGTCLVSRYFTISASDACGDTALTNAIFTWTADTLPPTLTGVPAGTNLGCNPTNIPTVAGLQAAVTANDTCSPATVTVTAACTTNSCVVTQIFTIVATNACNNMATAYVTNTWTLDTAAPVLNGVPASTNLGCNPTNIPTAASIKAGVSATDTCSATTINVTGALTTNGCAVTETFTILATNACGNKAVAYVTNTWTADTAPPVLNGLPPSKNLGCNPTNIPSIASILSTVTASDTCSPAVIHATCATTTNGCGVSQVFTIVATNACGNMATAYVTNTWTALPTLLVTNTAYSTNISYVTNSYQVTNYTISTNVVIVTNIVITTNCCTNAICGNFNSQNPGTNSWLWCNAHLSGNPGSNCTVYCSNASITLACTDGKSYSFPVPNGTINFSSGCTTATNWFDGTNWHTTLPCAGDDEIFVQGCAIPWQTDFANCQSACWTATFSCSTPGFVCNWQWGAACYGGSAPYCGNIAPKACHQTSCPNGQYYNSGDHSGCPENYKPYCVAGGTGGGGANCTGSWSPTSTTCPGGTKTNITTTPVTVYTTNSVVSTKYTTNTITSIVTNTTVSTSIEGPILAGVPTGMNFGCNPTNVPTVSSVQSQITASATCSAASVQVTMSVATNVCAVTQIFTITATNACGGVTTAYVTNSWTADKTPPVISGLPPNTFLGCVSITNLPGDSNVFSEVQATDQCSTPVVTVTHVDTTNGCTGTRTFTITATDACGNSATTNLIYSWTGHSPDYCTNSICAGFNSKNPGSGWLWLNAHCSGNPGQNCTLYCQNATVTLNCTDGKSYTYPVPNGTVCFRTNCTAGTNWFDGTNWNTILPCAGDDQIFLQGCAIPWQWDFANCQSVCWTGTFSCDAPGQAFNWQWGAACYANTLPAYTNICPKACHQTSCGNGQYFSQGDFAGCPENHKPYCVGGGTGLGGTNCTGSWSGTDTTCTFTAGTSLPPVLNGVPACDNLGINPTNIPTCASILKLVTATDTCSPAPVIVTCLTNTNGCNFTQIFTISATNDCGNSCIAYVTNCWTSLMLTNHCTNTICTSFNSQNPGSGWCWFNSQLTGKPGTNDVYIVCSNASVTLSCNSGKTYTYPVPCGTIHFSPSCTAGTNWFDGTNWNTVLPCGGDDQIFLSGCAIPWLPDFAGCRSVCWTGDYSCNVPGLSFNWQFGASCYKDNQPTDYNQIGSKACHQTPCQNGFYFNQGDNAGTPENHNPYCVGGGTGFGGNNWTGNFSNPGTCNF